MTLSIWCIVHLLIATLCAFVAAVGLLIVSGAAAGSSESAPQVTGLRLALGLSVWCTATSVYMEITYWIGHGVGLSAESLMQIVGIEELQSILAKCGSVPWVAGIGLVLSLATFFYSKSRLEKLLKPAKFIARSNWNAGAP